MSLIQSIPLKSIRNARELGGYTTVDGRTVKKGVLLRTGNLSAVSDEDTRLLTDTYRLQHIVDFRMPMELPGSEDPAITGAEYHHLNVIDLSTLPLEGAPDVNVNTIDLVEAIELTESLGLLNPGMYIGFLSHDAGKTAYADFFRVLLSADPERAALWHCTSGKDRTGLAAMLLLSAFGVDEETIVSDYLLTNEYNAPRIASARQQLKERGLDDEMIAKAVIILDAVDERFMRTAIAYLKDTYGSVLGYISGELHITDDEIELLKDKYLY